MSGINQASINPNYRQFARPAAVPQVAKPSVVGNMLGMSVRESIEPKALLKDAALTGLSNIPFDGLFSSQAYRRGDLKANEYVAHIVADSVGFGTWTIGGALATAAVGPAIGAALATAPAWIPAVAIGAVGFAAGMVVQELFDRAIGRKFAKKLAEIIPAKDVKPLADGFTKYIANPLNDHVWQPLVGFIKHHKVAAIAAGSALALKFPALGQQVLTMGGGMALGIGANLGLNKVLGPSADPFEKNSNPAGDIPVKPEWIKSFNDKRNSLVAQGESVQQATAETKQIFSKILVQNGMKQDLATTLTDAIAKASNGNTAAQTADQPATDGQALPAGMLMARGSVAPQATAGGQALPPGMLMAR